jgi:hypothetical protein
VGFDPPLNFACLIFQGFDVFALVFRVLDIMIEAVGEMLATHQPVAIMEVVGLLWCKYLIYILFRVFGHNA